MVNVTEIKSIKKFNYYLTDFGEGKYGGIDISSNYKTLSFINFVYLQNFLALRGTPFYFAPELDIIY